jgi:hypothetical protein
MLPATSVALKVTSSPLTRVAKDKVKDSRAAPLVQSRSAALIGALLIKK